MLEQLYKIIENVILSRALYVCCDLKIADYLHENPMTIQELSLKTGCNADALYRLMRVLSLNGFFKISNDYELTITNTGEILCIHHSESLRPFLLHEDETRWNSLGNLSYSIRTGLPSFDKLYNDDYFSFLKKNKQLSNQFNEAMHIISNNENNAIAQLINFDGIIADIGGGTGQLINTILKNNNKIECCYLLDLPEVDAIFEYQNCEKIHGSFFEHFTIHADTYILKRVLHDWDNDKAIDILKNLKRTMPTNSKLLIFEGIIDKTQDSKFLSSIDLLLLSIFGGKERTIKEFELILDLAGFKLLNNKKLTESLSMLECTIKIAP